MINLIIKNIITSILLGQLIDALAKVQNLTKVSLRFSEASAKLHAAIATSPSSDFPSLSQQ